MALTYTESANLMNEMIFRGRVKVACLNFASYILNEAPDVPGHSARIRWAGTTYQAPDQVAQGIVSPTVRDAAVQAAGLTTTEPITSAIDDAGLQTAVETVVNKMF